MFIFDSLHARLLFAMTSMIILARLGGGGGTHWYDLVFIALVAAMVYPDEILD